MDNAADTVNPKSKLALRYAIVMLIAIVLGVGVGFTFNHFYGSYKRKRGLQATTKWAVEQMQTVEIGNTLIDWTFETLDDDIIQLAKIIDDTTLIVFSRLSCGKCIDLLNTLQTCQELADRDQDIIVISYDDRLDLLRFRDDYGVDFPILWDRDGIFSSNLRLTVQPFMLVVDQELKITNIQAGELNCDEVISLLEISRR